MSALPIYETVDVPGSTSFKTDGGRAEPDHISLIDGVGVFTVHATQFVLGTIEDASTGGSRAMMQLAAPTRMLGLIYTMGVEEMRGVAAGLLQLADDMEARARTQADAALARAKDAR